MPLKGTQINMSDCITHLGIILDNTLTLNEHIKNVTSRTTKNVNDCHHIKIIRNMVLTTQTAGSHYSLCNYKLVHKCLIKHSVVSTFNGLTLLLFFVSGSDHCKQHFNHINQFFFYFVTLQSVIEVFVPCDGEICCKQASTCQLYYSFGTLFLRLSAVRNF